MLQARTELLLPTLQKVWGYSALRDGQRQAIESWCQGAEVVALLPTGGGKSMCYQLPALVERQLGNGTTLVISPLIALMQDQVDSLLGRGVKAAALNSHCSRVEQEDVEDALEAGLLDVLLVSPERAAQPRFRRLIAGCEIAMIAVDEAHCMSQWGHDFRPEYMRIGELRQIIDAPMMALTATATPRVVDEIVAGLELTDPSVIRGSFARPNLHFSVRHLSSHDERMEQVFETLDLHNLRGAGAGKAIIYCASRKKVEQVAADLKSANFRVGYYHAGRTQEARQKAQSGFDLGRLRVLVATNAFGMGVDYPDVRVIVHFQSPGSLEAYYQEAGRASRDGEPGHCLLFFSAGDMALQRRLKRDSKNRSSASQSLGLIESYAMSTECRQRQLCLHFDPDAEVESCGTCDVCTCRDEVEAAMEVVTSAACVETTLLATDLDIVIAAVDNLRKPVGKSSLARALRGSKAKALRKYGLHRLPQHGELKAHSEASICAAVEDLLQAGRLAPKGQKYPTVWIPGKAVRRATTSTETTGSGATAQKTRAKRPARKVSNLRRALELYRNRTAKKLGWKPYMVLHKKVIVQLETKRPSRLDQLPAIDGLGPVKIERFGWDILDIVRRYEE